MTPAITITNINKAYKHYPTIGAQLGELISCGVKKFHRLNWVLRDINFSVNPGEAVAIVGMNGAGKSTLLKIITGTSYPTSGKITINGRISALLELGIGFHSELTGRQNIFIAGQLLGYSNKDIKRLMPEIEAFAEIGSYIDRPLRVYSSGMKMRLAFSTATVIKPDIMIVDEALSVGDSYFQHKCFKRIRELLKQGTALLFVSHDHAAITAICDRAILLHNGTIAMQDKPEIILNYYNTLLADFRGENIQQTPLENNKIQTISGTKEASIENVNLYNGANQMVNVINVGEEVRLQVIVMARTNLNGLTLGYQIKDIFGHTVFGTNTHHLNQEIDDIINGELIKYNLSFTANLGPGDYSISIAIHTSYDHLEKNYEWRDFALMFNVTNIDKKLFMGTAWLPPRVSCSRKRTGTEIISTLS